MSKTMNDGKEGWPTASGNTKNWHGTTRLQPRQGTDVVSTNDLTFSAGNTFEITGTMQIRQQTGKSEKTMTALEKINQLLSRLESAEFGTKNRAERILCVEKIRSNLDVMLGKNVGMLRMWLNERPASAPLLTNEDIIKWLV